MNCLPAVWDIKNLRRAWRWVRSNPDAQYKTYFRPIYSAYAVSSDQLLADLGDRLRRGIYYPSPARKIFIPKPSGVLRPYPIDKQGANPLKGLRHINLRRVAEYVDAFAKIMDAGSMGISVYLDHKNEMISFYKDYGAP